MLRPSLASYGISKAAFGALTHKSLRSAARCRVKAVDSGRTEAGALVRRQVVHDHAVRAATRRAARIERDTVMAARAGAVIEADADFDASCGRRGLTADEHYSVPAECFAASPPD
jgi:hypothetical protein